MRMFKQASSRNHRGRSLRGKNAIKIFILVAICIWLLYQVKHSHDQKKAFEERNSNVLSSILDDTSPKILNLGRKVLPRSDMQRNHEDVVNEEDETNVPNPDRGEHDDRDTGDDRFNGNDFEKTVAEAEGVDEQQIEGSNGNSEESSLLEKEGQNTIQANSQEAREKHYNEDDVSSAVVRASQMVETEGVGEGTDNFAKEQLENAAEERPNFGGRSNGTSPLVETDNLQYKTQQHLLNETLTDNVKQMENIEKEPAHETLKSNTSTEANTSGILPGESGDRLVLNETMTNSTGVLVEVRDMAISKAVPPSSETAEVNSTTPNVLSKNITESQDDVAEIIHNEAPSVPFQNATPAFTSTTSKLNSTLDETETDGNAGSSDGRDDHVESLTASQDNGTLVLDEASIAPFQNATLTFNSTNKLNSTIGETETHATLGSSDGKDDHVEIVTSENVNGTNTTASMGLQENSTLSLASSSALRNGSSTSKESPNSTSELPSQDAPVAVPSIQQQKLPSDGAVTDEGRSIGLDANGRSHLETSPTAEDSILNQARGHQERESTSSFTAAEHNLQGSTLREPSVSPSNLSAGSETQTHSPRTPDSRVMNATSVDTAVA